MVVVSAHYKEELLLYIDTPVFYVVRGVWGGRERWGRQRTQTSGADWTERATLRKNDEQNEGNTTFILTGQASDQVLPS